MDDLTVIIPAAGCGRRMKSYGPKGLIDINGKTLLGRQIDIIKSALPNADIVVIAGFEIEKLRKFLPGGIHIIENAQYSQTNVAYSILLGESAAEPTNMLVIYGDLVFNKLTLNNLDFEESFVIVDSKKQIRTNEVGVNIYDGYVQNFDYSLKKQKWAQIVFLKDKELSLWKKITSPAGYADKRFGFEILNKVIDRGGQLRAVEPNNMRIAEIDSSKDIDDARKIGE